VPAFGNGGTVTGYGFTGREFDPETGLLYYRARYYDPKIGGFISEDPVDFEDGLTRYSYVLSNPVNLIDPTGYTEEPAACGGRCPHSIFTEYANACDTESNNPDAWIRRCMKKKCRPKSVMLTCDSPDCDKPPRPATYTPRTSSIVICTNNMWKAPCARRVIVHEIAIHACLPSNPAVNNDSEHYWLGLHIKRNVKCP
jgi:RHS repeat-associated protein